MKPQFASILAICCLALTTSHVRAQLGDCPALGAALVDHTCFHTIHGPFESVQATAGSTVSDGTPGIDAVHTEFRLGLTGALSTVTYLPARAGAWAIFLGSAEPLRVLDKSDEELEELFSASGDVGCGALVEAHVFEFVAGETVRLVFGPTSSSSAVVVLEYVEDFLIDNGRDADGDGYGTPDDTVRSACVPPLGYVQNAADCDDADPLLNPGVRETCDGVDQNCNGLPDDVGLECRAGQGECVAIGTVTCDGAVGERATCSAEPGVSAPETCDGKDNDCDGIIDGLDALCADAAEGPTCVRQSSAAFCGCALDQDCGTGDSGRVCDLAQRRCMDGCSMDPGRNGCAEGQDCKEADSGAGECMPEEASSAGGRDGDGLAGGSGVGKPDGSQAAGCGCRVGPSPTTGGAGTALVVLVGLLAGRRRSQQATPGRGARRAWIAMLSAALSSWACGGQIDDLDASGGSQADGCVPALGDKTVAHACSHTNRGPYVPVAASVSSPPDVSVLHKTFSVLVAEDGGMLTYSPKRDGEHVMLTNREVVLDVRDAATSEGSTLQGAPFPVEGCDTIAWAQRVELTPERTYKLRVGEAAGNKFELFIEYPPAFGKAAWEASCP